MKSANPFDHFMLRLKAKGLKATQQRLAIHSAMMEYGHASADMVADWISSHCDSKVTVASIYNNLSSLAKAGIYARRTSTGSKMFFDVNSSRHAHLYDTVNQEYRDIFDDDLMNLLDEHFRKCRYRGFKVDAIDVQLLCHPTRKNEEQI